MKYPDTLAGTFVDRPNRFIAHVLAGGTLLTVHVKNTGRCRELLLPGAEVALAASANPKRKTAWDLISVRKEGVGWINLDSQAPNAVVKEWLQGNPPQFPNLERIKPEYVFGASRVDFYLERGGRGTLLEVKGCTLEMGGVGYFPDAPTERGVKHLHELAGAAAQGLECYIAFVIAIPGVSEVRPNRAMHPEFGKALDEALAAGVKLLYLPCRVAPDELRVLPEAAELLQGPLRL